MTYLNIELPREALEIHIFASSDPYRDNLNCLLLEKTGNTVHAVTTDGHRMAVFAIDISEQNVTWPEKSQVFLSPKRVKDFLRAIGRKAQGAVLYQSEPTHPMQLKSGDHMAYVDSDYCHTYPEWRQVLPTGFGDKLGVFGVNTAYVGDLAKYFKACGLKGVELGAQVQGSDDGLGPIRFYNTRLPTFEHVIMPVRV